VVYTDRIHFEDVDYARIPFYGRYFSWVDRAWEQALNAFDLRFPDLMDGRHVGLPIVEAVCRYRRPLSLGDEFALPLRVVDLTRRGLTTEFRFRRQANGVITSEGHVHRRFMNMQTLEGTPVPRELYPAFEALAAGLSGWPDLA
jgi:acyl-CoA thioester hydrolase